jgi:hypothetical protein
MTVPVASLILASPASLPSQPGFRETLIVTVVVGVFAFAVSGGLLIGFIRSLSREGDLEEPQFTRRSAYWLTALILSLLSFSVLFMWNALGW